MLGQLTASQQVEGLYDFWRKNVEKVKFFRYRPEQALGDPEG
jgi:hypothetical protein